MSSVASSARSLTNLTSVQLQLKDLFLLLQRLRSYTAEVDSEFILEIMELFR